MFKNNSGFTLIEMLIVLMIISVLIILIVPKLSDSSEGINKKGCDALEAVVQAQANLFRFEKGREPADIAELVGENYITSEQEKCSNNTILIYENGVVSQSIINND